MAEMILNFGGGEGDLERRQAALHPENKYVVIDPQAPESSDLLNLTFLQ